MFSLQLQIEQAFHHDISCPLSAEMSKCHCQPVLISPDVTYSHVGDGGGWSLVGIDGLRRRPEWESAAP